MSVEQVKTPDIGGESGEIIEILVAEGDQIEEEQSLVVLESAKASMEVPSPKAGRVAKLLVSVGDNLEEGMPILDLELEVDGNEEGEGTRNDAKASQPDDAEEDDEYGAVEESAPEVQAEATATAASEKSQLIKVPDIGSDSAEVIELSVSVGDQVKSGDALLVAESEKASMDIPTDFEGRIEALHVKVGDQISEGQDLATILIVAEAEEPQAQDTSREEKADMPKGQSEETTQTSSSEGKPLGEEQLFRVPDLGSESAEVIEISVKPGDSIKEGDTLVVAESDKASLEVPAEAAGEIVKVHCAVGDRISQGDELVTLKAFESEGKPKEQAAAPEQSRAAEEKQEKSTSESSTAKETSQDQKSMEAPAGKRADKNVYAGPAVRKLAREFGIELAAVSPSGPRGRILKEDLHNYVRKRLKEPASGGALPSIADIDWEKFGPTHTEATTRIHRLTAENMQKSWLNVPHVTQFDDADVTELEEYRAMVKHEGNARGIKMTPLAFILKGAYKALKNHPKFNAALSGDASTLVYREYFHVGVAVDTPAGLMVPVVRDVDQKDIWQLAAEIAELADKAKNAKLKPTEMQGACFTVSSLGAIGGKGFTPIVPAPQVGILGVSKTSIQPVWDGEIFQPRKLMPLALSYDHRAVNGADAGKFLTYLVEQLGGVENIWSD